MQGIWNTKTRLFHFTLLNQLLLKKLSYIFLALGLVDARDLFSITLSLTILMLK
jgi:hypothetical protein